jgi:hypothetical protein
MFHKGYFLRHQRLLLFLLNAPVLRLWFRYVLRIHGERSHVRGREIVRILPNAVEWREYNGQRTIEIRTHAKFAKRLYFAYYPLWWCLHQWDTLFANRFVPAWNAGFDEFGPVSPDAGTGATTVDGYVARSGQNASWSSVRGGAGTAASASDAAATFVRATATTTTDQFSRITRSIFTFDTHLIGAGSVPTAGAFSIRIDYLTNNYATWTANVGLYGATPADWNNLVNADYGQCGTTAFSDAPQAFADLVDETRESWALNAAGLAAVDVEGISGFSCRFVDDAADNAPAWTSGADCQCNCDYADQTGTDNDPQLVVTYTPAATIEWFPQGRIVLESRSDGTT